MSNFWQKNKIKIKLPNLIQNFVKIAAVSTLTPPKDEEFKTFILSLKKILYLIFRFN